VTVDPEHIWGAFGNELAAGRLGSGPFDFISLDAEWMDFDILKSFPDQMLSQCRLLCIEPRNLSERESMRAYLLEKGMKTCHETPENLLVCR
jgi:hypothetical protein